MRLLILAIAVVGCAADEPEPDPSVCGNLSASIVRPGYGTAVTPGMVEILVHWSPAWIGAPLYVQEQLPPHTQYDPMNNRPPISASGFANYQFMLPSDTSFTAQIVARCYRSSDLDDQRTNTVILATSEFTTTP